MNDENDIGVGDTVAIKHRGRYLTGEVVKLHRNDIRVRIPAPRAEYNVPRAYVRLMKRAKRRPT